MDKTDCQSAFTHTTGTHNTVEMAGQKGMALQSNEPEKNDIIERDKIEKDTRVRERDVERKERMVYGKERRKAGEHTQS